MTRRKKRAKEKKQQETENTNRPRETEPELENEDVSMDSHLVDYFTPHVVIRTNGKVRSFDFALKEANPKGGTQVRLKLPRPVLSSEIMAKAFRGAIKQCYRGLQRSITYEIER